MSYNFAECIFAVGLAAEDRNALGPHDDSYRNQVDTCEHKPHRTVDAFSYGITQKSGVGNENSVSQTFLLIFADIVVGVFGIQHAESLSGD